MKAPTDRMEWQDLILKTAKAVEALQRDFKALSSQDGESGRELLSSLRTRVAKAEAAIEQLSPHHKRMDDAAITKYIIRTVQQHLAKQPRDAGTSDEADSVGNGIFERGVDGG